MVLIPSLEFSPGMALRGPGENEVVRRFCIFRNSGRDSCSGRMAMPTEAPHAGGSARTRHARQKIRHMPASWTARGSFQFRSRGGSSKLANNLAANSLRAWRCADMKHGRTDRTRSTKWVPRVPNTQAYARHPACASGDQKWPNSKRSQAGGPSTHAGRRGWGGSHPFDSYLSPAPR